MLGPVIESVVILFTYSTRALKGERGKDKEILAPVGIAVTTDDGKIIGMSFVITPPCRFYLLYTVLHCSQFSVECLKTYCSRSLRVCW